MESKARAANGRSKANAGAGMNAEARREVDALAAELSLSSRKVDALIEAYGGREEELLCHLRKAAVERLVGRLVGEGGMTPDELRVELEAMKLQDEEGKEEAEAKSAKAVGEASADDAVGEAASTSEAAPPSPRRAARDAAASREVDGREAGRDDAGREQREADGGEVGGARAVAEPVVAPRAGAAAPLAGAAPPPAIEDEKEEGGPTRAVEATETAPRDPSDSREEPSAARAPSAEKAVVSRAQPPEPSGPSATGGDEGRPKDETVAAGSRAPPEAEICGSDSTLTLDQRRRAELQAVMRIRSLSKEERNARMKEVKEKYARMKQEEAAETDAHLKAWTSRKSSQETDKDDAAETEVQLGARTAKSSKRRTPSSSRSTGKAGSEAAASASTAEEAADAPEGAAERAEEPSRNSRTSTGEAGSTSAPGSSTREAGSGASASAPSAAEAANAARAVPGGGNGRPTRTALASEGREPPKKERKTPEPAPLTESARKSSREARREARREEAQLAEAQLEVWMARSSKRLAEKGVSGEKASASAGETANTTEAGAEREAEPRGRQPPLNGTAPRKSPGDPGSRSSSINDALASAFAKGATDAAGVRPRRPGVSTSRELATEEPGREREPPKRPQGKEAAGGWGNASAGGGGDDDGGSSSTLALDQRKRSELRACMKDASLTKEERKAQMDAIKEKYARMARDEGTANGGRSRTSASRSSGADPAPPKTEGVATAAGGAVGPPAAEKEGAVRAEAVAGRGGEGAEPRVRETFFLGEVENAVETKEEAASRGADRGEGVKEAARETFHLGDVADAVEAEDGAPAAAAAPAAKRAGPSAAGSVASRIAAFGKKEGTSSAEEGGRPRGGVSRSAVAARAATFGKDAPPPPAPWRQEAAKGKATSRARPF
ncbi:hypothetical protein ACHAWF_010584 [Thalassiosira exigua]